jgi:hypothetical protein
LGLEVEGEAAGCTCHHPHSLKMYAHRRCSSIPLRPQIYSNDELVLGTRVPLLADMQGLSPLSDLHCAFLNGIPNRAITRSWSDAGLVSWENCIVAEIDLIMDGRGRGRRWICGSVSAQIANVCTRLTVWRELGLCFRPVLQVCALNLIGLGR